MPHDDDPTDPVQIDHLRRDLAALLAQVEAIRRVQALAVTRPPDDLSEKELSRRLVYDLLAQVGRSDFTLQVSLEIVAQHTEALRQNTEARLRAIESHRSQLAELEQTRTLERERESRRWVALTSVGSWIAKVAYDPRVIFAVGTVIAVGLAVLSWWLRGFITSGL